MSLMVKMKLQGFKNSTDFIESRTPRISSFLEETDRKNMYWLLQVYCHWHWIVSSWSHCIIGVYEDFGGEWIWCFLTLKVSHFLQDFGLLWVRHIYRLIDTDDTKEQICREIYPSEHLSATPPAFCQLYGQHMYGQGCEYPVFAVKRCIAFGSIEDADGINASLWDLVRFFILWL